MNPKAPLEEQDFSIDINGCSVFICFLRFVSEFHSLNLCVLYLFPGSPTCRLSSKSLSGEFSHSSAYNVTLWQMC